MKKIFIVPIIFLAACITNKPSTRIEFAAADAYPEGIAYDSAKNIFYVSSVTHATIGKVTPSGVYSVVHSDSSLKSTYGMKIHPDGKRLFVCVSDATYSRHSTHDTKKKMVRLISIDLGSGKKISDIDLTPLTPGKHFGNDLTFDTNNNIYMTDSYANVIYKITPAGTASVFSKSKLYETQGFGLNGIVFHPEGFLLVASSNKGRIYKVSITQPEDVKIVKVDQYLLGADGLILNNANTLSVVVNGGNNKIFQLTTKDHWSSARLSATTLAADMFTYPATATIKGKDLWVMNAKTTELQDSTSVPSKKFAIQKVVFKPLPK